MDRTSASGAGSLGSSPDGSAILQDLSVKNVISLKKKCMWFLRNSPTWEAFEISTTHNSSGFCFHFMCAIEHIDISMPLLLANL